MADVNLDDLCLLTDVARRYRNRVSYSALNYRAMKMRLDPKIVGGRRLYTPAQVQQILAELAGEVSVSTSPTPEV